MNRAILIGRITRDLELRSTNNGSMVTDFTVAINRIGSSETDFINVQVWNKQAENACKYLRKGSQVAVEGRINIDNYVDKDGNKRQSFRVIASNLEYIGSKDNGGDNTFVKNEVQDIPTTNNVEDADDLYADFGDKLNIDDISDDELGFY